MSWCYRYLCLHLPNQLLQATGDWCNRSTIIHWLQSKPDYCMYTKRIRPGLTEENRVKQIAFSKHVHNRWGLGPNAKILWTMSDEKWWFGLVTRTFAKMCPTLGIEKEVFSVHHKIHISKVMAHATVGYCFTGDPENGGEACLIQLHATLPSVQSGAKGVSWQGREGRH
jgi:hypothetical protein